MIWRGLVRWCVSPSSISGYCHLPVACGVTVFVMIIVSVLELLRCYFSVSVGITVLAVIIVSVLELLRCYFSVSVAVVCWMVSVPFSCRVLVMSAVHLYLCVL